MQKQETAEKESLFEVKEINASEQVNSVEDESEITFTVLDTSFTFGEPRGAE